MHANNPQFATTRWTLVWQAAKDSTAGRPALEEIVARYWRPLYYFARRQGLGEADAEDATQEFLWEVIHGPLLRQADPAKGKFRTFLLTAWKRFLIDQYRKSNAARRGGGKVILSMPPAGSDALELAWSEAASQPDEAFMLSWAHCVLAESKSRLRGAYEQAGKLDLFEALFPFLTMPMTQEQYSEMGVVLRMSSTAVKVAVHRLRQRFGESLRALVLETVEDPSEVEGEIGDLLAILRKREAFGA